MKPRRWTKEKRREQYRKGMYIIPSLFTVSNIFCGFYSVSSAVKGNYEIAGLVIGIAMILDTLDGRLARMTHTTSAFGVQLDSLADVITFGMAPAVLCYNWAFFNFDRHTIDRAGWLVCFVFLICAASRLARFNVQTAGPTDKRYFIGMPTPAAAGVIASTVYCFPDRLAGIIPAFLAIGIMALLSFLMVSRIKYRSFKDLNLREPRTYRLTVVIALLLVGMVMNLKIALLTIATLYTLSGLLGFFTAKKQKPVEVTNPASIPSN